MNRGFCTDIDTALGGRRPDLKKSVCGFRRVFRLTVRIIEDDFIRFSDAVVEGDRGVHVIDEFIPFLEAGCIAADGIGAFPFPHGLGRRNGHACVHIQIENLQGFGAEELEYNRIAAGGSLGIHGD